MGWRSSNKTPSREEMVYQKNLEICVPFFNILKTRYRVEE